MLLTLLHETLEATSQKGCLQGSVLAPLLLNMVVVYLLISITNKILTSKGTGVYSSLKFLFG